MITITALDYIDQWEGKYGVMHDHSITLSDGRSGTCSTKNATAPYRVGDAVEVEQSRTSKEGVPHFKVSKVQAEGVKRGSPAPSGSPASGGFRGGNDGGVGMCVGNAAKIASELICADKIPFNGSCEQFLGVTKKIAQGCLTIQKDLSGASAPPAAPQAPQQSPAASQAQPPQEPSYDPPANDIPVDDDDIPF